jgi:cobalt-zinc-cadmium efflux system outer membrane protein
MDLTTSARQAFADVLADQERLANRQELTRLAQKSHSIVVDRVAAGKVSPVEQTRSLASLADIELEEEKQEQELIASKDRLAALWGGTSLDFGHVEAHFEIPALSSDIEACKKNNPDLNLADAEVEFHRSALALEQALRKPDLTFKAGFRRSNPEPFNAWVAGVTIPLPLFDKRQGAIAEARIRLEQASAEKISLEQNLRSALAKNRHIYDIALLESTSLAETVLPAAAEALSSTEEGYQLGKFDYVNVVDAQRTYAQLQRRYIEAVVSGLKAAIEIDRLGGCDFRNLPTMEVSNDQ